MSGFSSKQSLNPYSIFKIKLQELMYMQINALTFFPFNVCACMHIQNAYLVSKLDGIQTYCGTRLSTYICLANTTILLLGKCPHYKWFCYNQNSIQMWLQKCMGCILINIRYITVTGNTTPQCTLGHVKTYFSYCRWKYSYFFPFAIF